MCEKRTYICILNENKNYISLQIKNEYTMDIISI